MVGSKSYLMVVKIHDAAVSRTFTSPVAARNLTAALSLFAKQLAAGALFFGQNDHPWTGRVQAQTTPFPLPSVDESILKKMAFL